ncbi:hypothetical protein QFC19_004773 [Naganishia cerealis]|uniref:Uncharacterized protein n=1 Tax=Naganishia cerealis TaxID=610337 RepID=A0ACC2VUB4_9TREE|nr:hypothetical protein QFC19_004773 [Naganishia cerealis]
MLWFIATSRFDFSASSTALSLLRPDNLRQIQSPKLSSAPTTTPLPSQTTFPPSPATRDWVKIVIIAILFPLFYVIFRFVRRWNGSRGAMVDGNDGDSEEDVAEVELELELEDEGEGDEEDDESQNLTTDEETVSSAPPPSSATTAMALDDGSSPPVVLIDEEHGISNSGQVARRNPPYAISADKSRVSPFLPSQRKSAAESDLSGSSLPPSATTAVALGDHSSPSVALVVEKHNSGDDDQVGRRDPPYPNFAGRSGICSDPSVRAAPRVLVLASRHASRVVNKEVSNSHPEASNSPVRIDPCHETNSPPARVTPRFIASRHAPAVVNENVNGRHLHVHGLAPGIDHKMLYNHFHQIAPVEYAHVAFDRNTQEYRTFGFVMMESQEGAGKAMSALRGKRFMSKKLGIKIVASMVINQAYLWYDTTKRLPNSNTYKYSECSSSRMIRIPITYSPLTDQRTNTERRRAKNVITSSGN